LSLGTADKNSELNILCQRFHSQYLHFFLFEHLSLKSVMTDSIKTDNVRPWNVGTCHNLPEEIRSRLADAHLIAWTTFDESLDGSISRASCCILFGPCFIFPCFWPFLIPCFPLMWMSKKFTETNIRSTFWILTDQDVKIFVRGTGKPSGRGKRGDFLQSIPLSQIAECSPAPAEGCCRNCSQSALPTLSIYTYHRMNESTTRVEKLLRVIGYGLKGYDWFATAVERQRDAGRAVCWTSPMDRGVDLVEHNDVHVSSTELIQKGSNITKNDARPHNVGTSQNLPEEIRIRSGVSNVIAWTTLDDQLEGSLGPAIWWTFICFAWPLLIQCPCLLLARDHLHHEIRHNFWILTDTEVKIFVPSSSDRCLCCCGDTHRSIPLAQIAGFRLQSPHQSCLVKGLESIPKVYLDSIFTPTEEKPYEAMGYGLAGSDWFVAATVNQINQ
jgi:hypothetical protein